jgi:predicted oxidoreductase
MLDRDKIKVKLALRQMEMVEKTMKKYGDGALEECERHLSDMVVWSNYHLRFAADYLRAVVRQLENDDTDRQ